MADPEIVVRCPRCGSMDAGSVEAILELSRMRCEACGYEDVVDPYAVHFEWRERVARAPAAGVLLPSVRFEEMWRELGATGRASDVLERLRSAYDEPHRAYHDARHVSACLRLFDEPAVRALAAEPAQVEAALWFHDAVYDTRAADNEERSAVLAEDSLQGAGVAADVARRIGAHVRATKEHVATSPDAQLVLDVDLSILGEPGPVFARFEQDIRREYAWVEPSLYASGRTAVLRRLTERPFIYGTALFRARFEERARANVADALARLAASP